jgi:hypothetical protein
MGKILRKVNHKKAQILVTKILPHILHNWSKNWDINS